MNLFRNILLGILLHMITGVGIAQSFSGLAPVVGSSDYSFSEKDKIFYTFRAHIPKTNNKTIKPSLVIALHWSGGKGTYAPFHDCLVVPGLKGTNAIIISPEGDGQSWSTKHNVQKIQALIANAVQYWNADPERVVLTGYSRGGIGSWYFAKNHPRLFSAIIPMASALSEVHKIDVPIYAIQGGRDELFPYVQLQKQVNASKAKGSNITLIVSNNLSHYEGCNYVSELQKAVTWLNTVWSL